MSDLYRDPLVHVHDRIAELRRRAGDLAADLSDEFLSHHEKAHAEARDLEAHVALLSGKSDSTADLLALEQTLRDHVRVLERLHAELPKFVADQARVPSGRPPSHIQKRVHAAVFDASDDSAMSHEKHTLARAVRGFDDNAEIAWDTVGGRARVFVAGLESDGVPISFAGALSKRGPDYPMLHASLSAYTSQNARALVVEPRGFLESVARVLRVGGSVDMHDEEFDRAFVVDAVANEPAPLPPVARRALLDLAPCSVSLRIDEGIVRLTWSYELTSTTIQGILSAGISCVRTVRNAARTDRTTRPSPSGELT